ncbi:MAG: nickel-dependent lactate racemase [Clostridiaceae bacterium]|nr:nickel-dependent lactate racemase [Clostridiaceae bacterium]
MKKHINLGIDNRFQTIAIEEDNLLDVLHQNDIEYDLTGMDAVADSLKKPIGTKTLTEIIQPGESVVIVTSDLTRPLPSHQVLPPILNELEEIGVKDEEITIVFALGSHRKQTEAEMRELVGDDIFERYKTVDGDLDDVVHLGETTGGTPIDIDRTVAEADRRICLGNIEYHYFAGYSGGAKAIMPGVSTRAAIQANHSNMTHPKATAGNAVDNPVRNDLEEAIQHCPIDFIVNVVLNENKEIIHSVAGHFIEAHREGCKFLDKLYLKPIDQRADIVIASQGGAPKDLNLYQTQKALDNTKFAVADGGVVILVGSCKEGMGEEVFAEWMSEAKDPKELIKRIELEFKLGGHKAAAIALVMERADIYLVSDMDDDFVRSIFMTPFDNVEDAYQAAREKLGDDAKVLVMPYGGSTLPRVKGEIE